ncbi:glycogen-binding domain-containing protein, partial [Schleiferia thermophila]|uniref:glycogen-binding domain-containing protein n=1 Tax=Schleiferia thermophila TaxID=884107 RepID=UPI00190F85B7
MRSIYFFLLCLTINSYTTHSQSVKTVFRTRIPDGTNLSSDVKITGNFFGSSGQSMSHIGGGVFEYELFSSCGKRISYSFTIDNQNETIQSGCCIGSTSARSIVIPDADTLLPTVCFSSCDSCETGTLVTFKVALQNPTAQGVYIAGSFNNWSLTSSPMTFDSVQGLYQYSTVLTAGTNIEYKFVLGNQFENVQGLCASGSFNNRTLSVPTSDTILPVVCFSS